MADRLIENNRLLDTFQARIEDPLFPCVGAKSALSQHNIEFLVAGDLRAPHCDAMIAQELQAFAARTARDVVFVSKMVLFPSTPPLDEDCFEQALWQRVQALHCIDANQYRWDSSVSSDPDSPHFSLSLGGRGFYVVGLHPGSSRPARRFDCAALVFNLHSQFETLRAAGRYDKLRESITDRDIVYSGSRNPMLAVHGEASEARQYSGRKVNESWRCPFSACAEAVQEESHRDAA